MATIFNESTINCSMTTDLTYSNSSANNSYSSHEGMTGWQKVFSDPVEASMVMLQLLLCAVILIGNTITITTMHLEKTLCLNIQNKYINSLAVSDQMMGINQVQLVLKNYFLPGEFWLSCQMNLALIYTCTAVGLLTMLAIAIDRYCYIVHPFVHMRHVTGRRVTILISILWLLAVVYGMVPIYIFDAGISQGCNPFVTLQRRFVAVSHPIFFFIDCFGIGITYGLIAKVAKEHCARKNKRAQQIKAARIVARETSTTGVARPSKDKLREAENVTKPYQATVKSEQELDSTVVVSGFSKSGHDEHETRKERSTENDHSTKIDQIIIANNKQDDSKVGVLSGEHSMPEDMLNIDTVLSTKVVVDCIQSHAASTVDKESNQPDNSYAASTVDKESNQPDNSHAASTVDKESNQPDNSHAASTVDKESNQPDNSHAASTVDKESNQPDNSHAASTVDKESNQPDNSHAASTVDKESNQPDNSHAASTVDKESNQPDNSHAASTVDTESNQPDNSHAASTVDKESNQPDNSHAASTVDKESNQPDNSHAASTVDKESNQPDNSHAASTVDKESNQPDNSHAASTVDKESNQPDNSHAASTVDKESNQPDNSLETTSDAGVTTDIEINNEQLNNCTDKFVQENVELKDNREHDAGPKSIRGKEKTLVEISFEIKENTNIVLPQTSGTTSNNNSKTNVKKVLSHSNSSTIMDERANHGQPEKQLSPFNMQSLRWIKQMVVVFGLFFVCWTPSMVVIFMSVSYEPNKKVVYVLSLFGMSNSAVNFFVYSLYNKMFRAAIKRTIFLGCRKHCKSKQRK